MQINFSLLKKIKKITLAVSLLVILNGCALYSSKPVTDAVNQGEIEIGMSSREAREILGSADEVAKQTMPGGKTREVWTYYEYGPNLRGCTLALFSSCSAPFVPFKAKLQYVIFEDDKLVGWNLPDPFQQSHTIDESNL